MLFKSSFHAFFAGHFVCALWGILLGFLPFSVYSQTAVESTVDPVQVQRTITLPPAVTPTSTVVPSDSPAQLGEPLHEPVLEPEGHHMQEGATPAVIQPSADLPEVAPPTESAVETFSETELDHLALLRRKWFERQRVLEVADVEVADNLLSTLVSLRLDLGVSNLVPYSQALIRESERAFELKQYKRALLLADYALELSPDYPNVYYFNARMVFRNNPFAIAEVISLFSTGVWMQGATLPQALRQMGNFSIFLALAVLGSFCVSLFLILFKSAHLLTHTLQHVLIIKMPKSIGQVMTLVFLFIPIVLQLGIGWVLLFWSLIFLPYVRPAEKVFLSVIIALLVTLPYLLPLIAGTVTARSESAYQYILAMDNHLEPTSLEKFKLRQQKSDPTGVDAFVLGYIYKKRGAYSLAKMYDEQALLSGYSPAATRNNLGNVLFASGDPYRAIEMYKKASAAQSNLFESDYNLGQAYFEIKDVQRASDAWRSAQEKKPRMMTYQTKIKSSNFNRLLADVRINDLEILRFVFSPSPLKGDLQLRYWNLVMRPLEVFSLPFFVLIVIALWVAVLLLGKFLKFPLACSKCSEAACQWCYATSKRTDLCSQCFHVFVRKEGVDPLARETKSREIAEHDVWRHRFTRILTVLIPGSGHFFLGKTFRGLFLQMFFLVIIMTVFFWEGFFVSPIPISFSGSLFKIAGLIIVGGSYYVLVLRNIVQE